MSFTFASHWRLQVLLLVPRDDGEHTDTAFSSMEKLTAPLRCQPCGPLILHAPCGFTSHALIAQCGRTPCIRG